MINRVKDRMYERDGVVIFMGYVCSLALLIMISASSVVAQSLTFVTEEQRPMNFTDPETGEVAGISTQLVKAMLDKAGLEGEFKLMPWRRAFRLALSAPNTCVYTTVRTPEREASFQWVGPLFFSGWAFFRRTDSQLVVEGLQDLKGKVISLTTGTRRLVPLDDLEGIHMLEVASDEKAILLLDEGRADLWVSGVFTAESNAEAAGVPEPSLAFLWRSTELSVACSPATSNELISRLNIANRELDDLRQKLKNEYYYTLSGKQ